MARTRTMASIDAKIKKAQAAVEQTKDRYDAAVTELERWYEEKKKLELQELSQALAKSSKSYEDVMRFINDGTR